MKKQNSGVAGVVALLLAVGSLAAQAQNISCVGKQANSADCLRPSELPIVGANSAPGKFASRMIFLADQLERNVDHKIINALSKSSPMGRLIAENLMHELQVRSWKIFEPRLMQNFMINEGGEFVLSRDVKQLKTKFGVSGVVAGTYVVSGDYTVVNARVINADTGMVISSGQIQIPSNWFADSLMTVSTNRPMKIIGAPQ